MNVKISIACMRQIFHPCDPDYIVNVCHGRCCENGTGHPRVSINPSEVVQLTIRGGAVDADGFMVQTGKKCQFKKEEGFCGLHGSGFKPFGCIVSPFALNKRGTLIVRNRFRLLICYRNPGEGGRPAYIAHRGSLVAMFGEAETARMSKLLDDGYAGDLYLKMDDATFDMMMEKEKKFTEFRNNTYKTKKEK